MSGTSEKAVQLSSSQRILLALDEAVTKLDALERAKSEPIAIVGMSCRFPGRADNPESFWQLLRNGVDAIGEIPCQRWNVDDYYDPDPEAKGKIYTGSGGFLEEVDRFDAEFFGISPREALSMDPQQRLLLEVTWEALENARQAPDQLLGSRTGIFLGIGQNDYFTRVQLNANQPSGVDVYATTGNGFCFAAGRLSYILGVQGPNMAIDTACSSSLVALHLACQSLRNRESDLAVIGGVQLILSPEITLGLSRMQALSPDGRCKTFSQAADGYGRGEGCGVIVCKRLADALAKKDNILAVIRGSAVNHDGASSGLTVPNGLAQQELLRQVLANAKLDPAEIDYIEAHGTGTSLGDPIEMNALAAVFGAGRSPQTPLFVGSVKTNIGHLEAAAGIAGLIKVILSLQHGEIPPHLHFKHPSSYIPWDKLPVSIPTEPVPWPKRGKSQLAGISSFGISGTNAHVIVEAAPTSATSPPSASERPVHLLALSAKSSEALKQQAQRYAAYLSSHPDLALADVCFSANTGRAHFNHRLGIVATSLAEAREQLESSISEGFAIKSIDNPPKIAFLFTGQGSQYAGMGWQLYQTNPTFRQSLERCQEILNAYLDRPLLSILDPQADEAELLNETAYTQPALFALEYALAHLWQSWGVQPTAVMGHSVGEYVAACLAGVFSLEDGLKLSAQRGRLMQALPKTGAMVALLTTESQVLEVIELYRDRVAIAASNGPESVVISGERDAIQAVCTKLSEAGIKSKPLAVSHAFHSPLMDSMLTEFEQVARQIRYGTPRLALISNLTGQLASAEVATPEYWCRHVRQTVKFFEGMSALGQRGYDVLVEVGPQPTLLGMGRNCLPLGERLWLPSLRPGQDDWQQLLESLKQLYERGVSVDWSGFERDYSHLYLQLPTYPWQHQSYWIETSTNPRRQLSSRQETPSFHPLLGQRLYLAESERIRFESQLAQDAPAYLAAHCVYQKAILPATGYLEMALSAGVKAWKTEQVSLAEVTIQQPLILPAKESKTLQLVLTAESPSTYAFQIFSLTSPTDGEEPIWTLHTSGKINKTVDSSPSKPKVNLEDLKTQYSEVVPVADYYRSLHQRGMEFGAYFQAIAELYRCEGGAWGRIRLPDSLVEEADSYQVHPVLLDACLQILGAALTDKEREAFLPVAIAALQIYRRPDLDLWSRVQINPAKNSNSQDLSAEISLFDLSGNLVAQLERVSLRRVSRQILQRILQPDYKKDWLYRLAWQLQPLAPLQSASTTTNLGQWLILTDRTGIGEQLAQALTKKGESCVLVVAGSGEQKLRAGIDYQIDPSKPAEFQRLLATVINEYLPCRGIIHLWSITEVSSPTQVDLQDAQQLGCGSALHLVQALLSLGGLELPRLWLVTQGAQPVTPPFTSLQVWQAPLWGLGRVLALEHPELPSLLLDLDPLASTADNVTSLLRELAMTERENQIAYRQGSRHVARLEGYREQRAIPSETLSIPSEPYQVRISDYGILENLQLVPVSRRAPQPNEVEIEVRAVGLNFRDVLNALGMLREYTEQMGVTATEDLPFGGECAGVIVAVGDKVSHLQVGAPVIAAQALGSLGSHVTVCADFVVPKPPQLTFEEAATLPTTFLTAYYALYRQAQLKAGERILIHAAAGGVGQAAVQLAQRVGAEVFATASPSKWEFLKTSGIQQIMNSRTVEFAEQVQAVTQGQGVEVVLNSLNGEFIPKSLETLAVGGRFVEIGKIGIWDEAQIKAKRPDVSYLSFDLLELSWKEPKTISSMLEELMGEFERGTLHPLAKSVFSIQELVSAFRYMAQTKHMGKVVISIPPLQQQGDVEISVRGDSSYLITGGLGALGLQVAKCLVDQGARYLVLTGLQQPSEPAQAVIAQLEAAGVQVSLMLTDVSERPAVEKSLAIVKETMPPLRGIVHAAGVLDDGMLSGQTWERFMKVMAPKVAGTWNLHLLTQALPLDFFVSFSSMAAILGGPGQSNYAAANTFMDVLAYYRQGWHLPALSINWGPWSAAGMVATLTSRDRTRLARQGIKMLEVAEGLQVLIDLLKEPREAQIGVLPVDWSKFLSQIPPEVRSPFWQAVTVTTESSTSAKTEFLQQLEAAPVSRRKSLLMAHVRSQIAKVLGLKSSESIEPQQGLAELGMDSLVAVELRNRLQTSLGRSIPSTLAFDYPTLQALVDFIAQDLLHLALETPVPTQAPSEAVKSDLQDLSDSEAEALLLNKLNALRY